MTKSTDTRCPGTNKKRSKIDCAQIRVSQGQIVVASRVVSNRTSRCPQNIYIYIYIFVL